MRYFANGTNEHAQTGTKALSLCLHLWATISKFGSTCGDAVKRLRLQVVDFLVQLRGRAFAVNLIHGGVGAVYPLHQPFQLAVTREEVPTQISGRNISSRHDKSTTALSFPAGIRSEQLQRMRRACAIASSHIFTLCSG